MRQLLLGVAAASALAFVLSGCAQKPQQTTMQLSTVDPKFNSPECLSIREKALTYDDKVGERVAIGLVSGLLLGPFGLPIAASADHAQNQEREAFNREIELRCITNPPPRKKDPDPDLNPRS